ncbi:hypothetical protein ACIBU0_03555 [Streptomyces sp. NPDC049627]|uniref:hypothetical protein n=1 Tax=Streptomyces sp. NPDC049627 TaxID=3365595 RepID=UPI00379E2570
MDGLDENPSLSRLLPLGPEGPENLTWIVTSRPGQHLDRFTPSHGAEVTRFDLDAEDARRHRLDDAERYVHRRLCTEDVANALVHAPQIAVPPPEFAHRIARASNGNFLYLHHLLHGLEEAARDGRLPPALSGAELPASLEGIYRHLVSERLYAHAGAEWRSSYAPVLGVLAVARAPLRVPELALAAGVDVETVDDVLGQIEQFTERVPVPGDLAFTLYHRSFGEFLLNQDRSRNPRPLRPAAMYHARLASSFDEFPDNGYVLRHMAEHLAEAGQVDRLVSAATGPFLRRQWEILGAPAALGTLRLALRAAADAGRDDLLVALLDRGRHLENQLRQDWESGTYVLNLLDGRAAVEQRGRTGGLALPFSQFLAIERLLDLEAPEAAGTLLQDVLRRPWPRRRTESVRGIGLAEGSPWDLTDEPLAHFLARVAELDAETALALTTRLYPESPDLPNTATAWRDTLRALMARSPTDRQCRAVTDATMAWLSRPRHAQGVASLLDTLWAVIAGAARSAEEKWVASTVATASVARLRAPSRLEGFAYDNVTAALGGMYTVMESLDHHMADTMREAVSSTLREVPMPERPDAAAYSARAESYGRLAWLAHRSGLGEFDDMAAVALDVCALDASLPDRTASAIAAGLTWLEETTPEVRSRALETARRHGLDGALARSREAAAQPERSVDVEASLSGISDAADVHAAGRSALAVWRQGTASRAEIAEALRGRRRRPSRTQAQAGPHAADLLREAFVRLLLSVSAPWAPELAEELMAQRQADRQVAVPPDRDRIRSMRWSALASHGSVALLRSEALARWEEAGPDEVNARLDCCLAACCFDPDIADRWWQDLAEALDDLDRGSGIVLLVHRLATAHPDRVGDLGRRWSSRLPRFASHESVASFEPDLCHLWHGVHPLLQPHIARTLRRFSQVLENEFERVSADRSENGWRFVGDLLGVAGVAGTARAAATRMSHDIVGLWRQRSDDTTATRHAVGILRGVVGRTQAAMHAGPAADAVATLLGTVDLRTLNHEDRVTVVRTAGGLKSAAPALSRRLFEATLADVGARERRRPGLEGMLEGLVDVIAQPRMARPGSEFGSLAEKRGFQLVESLASWSTGAPVDRSDLLAVHRGVMGVENVDRRAVLFGALAAGWLRLRDWERARAAAAVAAPGALSAAGYYSGLAELALGSAEEPARSARELVLDGLLRHEEMTEDAATSIFVAWFGLRCRASAPGRDEAARIDPDALRGIVRTMLLPPV